MLQESLCAKVAHDIVRLCKRGSREKCKYPGKATCTSIKSDVDI